MKLFLLTLICVCLLPLSYGEAAETQFFQTLQDIPLMAGLQEIPSETMSFDKADGRIIEVHALLEHVSGEEVFQYYQKSLPQFGWRPTMEKRVFKRDGEQLEMSIEHFENEAFLKFIVSPL